MSQPLQLRSGIDMYIKLNSQKSQACLRAQVNSRGCGWMTTAVIYTIERKFPDGARLCLRKIFPVVNQDASEQDKRIANKARTRRRHVPGSAPTVPLPKGKLSIKGRKLVPRSRSAIAIGDRKFLTLLRICSRLKNTFKTTKAISCHSLPVTIQE